MDIRSTAKTVRVTPRKARLALDMIRGKSVEEALSLTNKAVAEALDGLPAHKMHCSVLAEEAIKSAIDDYNNRKNGEK